MTGGPWRLIVPDEHGRKHRGTYAWGDDVPAALLPGRVFHVSLCRSPEPHDPPSGMAICIPGFTKETAAVPPVEPPLPDIIELELFREYLMLPQAIHAQYRAGSVVTPGGPVDPSLIFTQRGGRPIVDIIRLALILVKQGQADRIAPYTGVIRHELALPAGADALGALRLRLDPADAESKPPAGAPAIKRLSRALASLESGKPPRMALEKLSEDLRFLALFEDPAKSMRREALDRLLDDVMAVGPEKPRTAPRRKPARITRLPRREDT